MYKIIFLYNHNNVVNKGDFMQKRKNNQKVIISLLLIIVLLMTVGYALYTEDLTINGTTNIGASTWDVHFDTNSYKESDGSVSAITHDLQNTSMTYTVTLNKPGDFYEFSINVLNLGTFDAKLDAILLSTLTEQQKKYLTYTVNYGNTAYTETANDLTDIILSKQTGSESVKVRVEYIFPENETDLPVSGESNISLTLTLSYSQSA